MSGRGKKNHQSNLQYAATADRLNGVCRSPRRYFNKVGQSILLIGALPVEDLACVVKQLDKKEQAKKWFQLASCMELSGCRDESVTYYQSTSLIQMWM